MNTPDTYTDIFDIQPDIENIDYKLLQIVKKNYAQCQSLINNPGKYFEEMHSLIHNLNTHTEPNIRSVNSSDSASSTNTANTTKTSESPENSTDIERLIPPYNIPCYMKSENCLKMAAFKKISSKQYYCWFHVHTS